MQVHTLVRNGVRNRALAYCVPGAGDPEGELPDGVFSYAEKETFLNGLDFLVVAIPFTDATEGLIGEQDLRALPSTACVLNPHMSHRLACAHRNLLPRSVLCAGWVFPTVHALSVSCPWAPGERRSAKGKLPRELRRELNRKTTP